LILAIRPAGAASCQVFRFGAIEIDAPSCFRAAWTGVRLHKTRTRHNGLFRRKSKKASHPELHDQIANAAAGLYHRGLAKEAALDVIQQYHSDLVERLSDEAAPRGARRS
jgi:hypothetical protein